MESQKLKKRAIPYVKLKEFKEVEKFLEERKFLTGNIGKYIKIKRESFDDLVIEKIGKDEYSMAYYYRHPSGDSLREPEITFYVKNYDNKKTFIPASYTLDSFGIYWDVELQLGEHENKPTVKNAKGNLKTFQAVWDNLREFNNMFKNLDYDSCEISNNP